MIAAYRLASLENCIWVGTRLRPRCRRRPLKLAPLTKRDRTGFFDHRSSREASRTPHAGRSRGNRRFEPSASHSGDARGPDCAADGRYFTLRPRALGLGLSYLNALPYWAYAQRALENLRNEIGESCAMAVLDEDEIVYALRLPARRILSANLGVGSRLPAHGFTGASAACRTPCREQDCLSRERNV